MVQKTFELLRSVDRR